LVIFDLNKTLLLAARAGKFKSFGAESILETLTPNFKTSDSNIYFREGRNELLDFLFVKVSC